VPAPRDALLFPSQLTVKGESTALVEQLVPLQLPESAQTDADTQGLLFVGQEIGSEPHESKPLSKPPAYWYWATFKTWLLDPLALTGQAQVLSKLGLPELAHERRSHVSIDADKEVAEDGMLFETSGLEFTVPGSSEHRLKEARRLALAVAADDSNYSIRAGLARFGGERRIVTWRKSTEKLPPCPPKLEQAIIKGRSCRVILLTPACFEQGSRPVWFSAEAAKYGVTIDLKAMVIQRPQVVSGWDFASNKPKPSRRLAPAGTVLYLSLRGDDAAISKWIRDTWMQCISDGEQDRLDGFGVVVFGTWLGNPLDGEVI
jgi:CRISPR-associated protein Cmr3